MLHAVVGEDFAQGERSHACMSELTQAACFITSKEWYVQVALFSDLPPTMPSQSTWNDLLKEEI